MEINKSFDKIGIYCIENTVNGKKYIGSSKNIKQRLFKHRSLLRHNKHQNVILQNAWNKHGEISFKCYVITECIESELESKEQQYIDTLNTYYNITRVVERNMLSKESRLKQSKTRKDRIAKGEIKKTFKEIHKYSKSGEYIESYSSIKEACLRNNIHHSSICRNLKGLLKAPNGLRWSLTKEERLPVLKEVKQKRCKLYKKVEIILYGTDTIVFKFNSVKECAEHFNIYSTVVSNNIKFKRKFKNKYMIRLVTA